MFFFPLRDDNPTHGRPYISWAVLALCILVFMWQISLGAAQHAAVLAYGMIPARLFGFDLPVGTPELVPDWMTLFSSMFMHGGIMHLAGNMLYLWIFSDNVEDSIGHGKFIVFYALCGVAAALAQAFVDIRSPIPMIGASGAIAGVLGSYLLLHPRANVRCIVGIFIFFRLVNVPAFIVLGGWIALQFLSLGQTGSGVAYVAHIGGFVAGMALIPVFKKPHIPLFDKPHSRAFSVEPLTGNSHIPTIPRRNAEPDNRRTPWD